MTFKDLHTEAVAECGQSDLMLSQVLLNDKLEREGRLEFAQEAFDDCLDRAIAVYMPYYDSKNVTHEKYANLYALTIANHRSEIHSEDRKDEIDAYTVAVQTSFEDGDERVEVAVKSWWGG